MNSLRVFSILVLVVVLMVGESLADTNALEQRLAELEQQVAVLKRQIEIDKENAAQKEPDVPIVTASPKDGFSIKSPNDSFKLRVRGLVQADARIYTDNRKDLTGSVDNFLIRRARPVFEGTVGKIFDFYLMPDFASNSSSNTILVDAYADIKLSPALKFRGGKFKAPFGLERLQSDAVANFIESGLPTNLVPNRDVGFQVFGDVLDDSVNYAVGIFNGGADLASVDAADTNSDKDVIGRIFVQPFKNIGPESLKGLGLGLASSYGHKEGSSMPTYRSPGQLNIFAYNGTGNTVSTASSIVADGNQTRISPQLYYYKGSLGLLGEYVASNQKFSRTINANNIVRNDFTNKAWQVSGNYVLTGELASYKGITPRNYFDLEKGTWGALEVVGRYGQLRLDSDIFDNGYANLDSVISQENAWALGFNWYLHKNVRLSVDYEQTHFDRGASRGADRPVENIVFTRLQLSY